MSVCGPVEEEPVSEEAGTGSGGGGGPVRELYQQKSVSKLVRVLTVLAYLLSVSLAAILLSVYYVCVWKSPELPPLNDTEDRGALQGDHNEYLKRNTHFASYGGSSAAVNSTDTPSTVPSPPDTSEPPSTPPDPGDLSTTLQEPNSTFVSETSTERQGT